MKPIEDMNREVTELDAFFAVLCADIEVGYTKALAELESVSASLRQLAAPLTRTR